MKFVILNLIQQGISNSKGISILDTAHTTGIILNLILLVVVTIIFIILLIKVIKYLNLKNKLMQRKLENE